MRQIALFVAATFVAGVGFGGLDRSAAAQPAPGVTAGRRLPLPLGGLAARSAGVYWLAALTPGGSTPTVERLLAVAPDGLVVEEIVGSERRVVLTPSLQYRLVDGTAGLTLVHNHPQSVGLSGADLYQLRKAGVARIVAVGHDQSVYEATAGPRFDPATFASRIYPDLQSRVISWIEFDARTSRQDASAAYLQVSHLVALILDHAGVIVYRSTLSRAAEETAGTFGGLFHIIVGAESKRLTSLLRK